MEVNFQHFTQSGKMLKSVYCCRSQMYTVIMRATTIKTSQKDMLKNITNQAGWNSLENIQIIHKKGREKKQENKNHNKHKTNNKMVDLCGNTIITLNTNDLNTPIKRQRLAAQI